MAPKTLNPAQRAKLEKAGLTPIEIDNYAYGKALPHITTKADVALGLSTTNSPIVTSKPTYTNYGGDAKITDLQQSRNPVKRSDILNTQLTPGNPLYSKSAPAVQSQADKSQVTKLQNELRIRRTAQDALDRVNKIRSAAIGAPRKGQSEVDTNPYPSFPDMGSSVVQTKTAQDYTAEAMALANQAFAPVQSMLDANKVNVGQQGERSRQIVGGLYDNLVKDIASKAAEQSAGYDESKQVSADAGAKLAADIGQNYASGNQQTADLLQKIGGQAAAPQVLQQGANDQAYQQSQAATNTAGVGAYFDKQKQGQADYNQQLGTVEQQQGISAQSDIMNQVQQMLLGIDAQKADAQTQASNSGLSLSQQMQQQDTSSAQSAQQQALAQYQAQVDQYNTQNTNKRNDAQDTAAANQQIFDNNLALQGAGGTVDSPQSGKSLPETRAVYATQDPENGGGLFDDVFKLAQSADYVKQGAGSLGLSDYLQAARSLAVKTGRNEDQAAIMAADIYNQMYGTG